MSIDRIRQSPTGRRMPGFASGAMLAMGYARSAGPTNVPDANEVLLVTAIPTWPAGLLPANARLGILGFTSVNQAEDDATLAYGGFEFGCYFSGVSGSELRGLNTCVPKPTDVLADRQTVTTQFLSAVGDAALAVGMTVSLQGADIGPSVPIFICEGSALFWYLTGS